LISGVSANKSFVVQRDLPGGKTRRVTIGATNVLSLDAARERAKEILSDLYAGRDPKATTRDRVTLRAALEAYLKGNSRLRPTSVRDYRQSVERHLTGWLDRPLRDISATMVIERHGAIAGSIKAEGRYDGRATADGTMRCLRSVWNATFEHDENPPANPTRVLRRRWFGVDRRTRLVTADQLPQFYAAVRALPNPVAADYLLMLLFCGLRREEAAGLQWSDIDLAGRTLRLPAARVKGRKALELPLTDYVRDLLVRRRSLGDAKYVFPANSKSGHLSEPKFPLGQIALATGIAVSCHDLRRTYITVAEGASITPLELKMLVGHSTGGDVTQGYVIVSPQRLAAAAQVVCDKMKELCGVTATTGTNVVRYR
jgi:integrase